MAEIIKPGEKLAEEAPLNFSDARNYGRQITKFLRALGRAEEVFETAAAVHQDRVNAELSFKADEAEYGRILADKEAQIEIRTAEVVSLTERELELAASVEALTKKLKKLQTDIANADEKAATLAQTSRDEVEQQLAEKRMELIQLDAEIDNRAFDLNTMKEKARRFADG